MKIDISHTSRSILLREVKEGEEKVVVVVSWRGRTVRCKGVREWDGIEVGMRGKDDHRM